MQLNYKKNKDTIGRQEKGRKQKRQSQSDNIIERNASVLREEPASKKQRQRTESELFTVDPKVCIFPVSFLQGFPRPRYSFS